MSGTKLYLFMIFIRALLNQRDQPECLTMTLNKKTEQQKANKTVSDKEG